MRASSFNASRKLGEENLLKADAACPVCGGGERSEEFWLQRDPDVRVLYCAGCHARSASRMPTAKTLADYYGGYYDHNPTGITFQGPRRMVRHLVRLGTPTDAKDRLTIVDFGGGDGTLGTMLGEAHLRRGMDRVFVCLVDPQGRLRPSADSRVEQSVRASLEGLAPGTVDLVLASGVIEHIPRPRETLSTLLRLLRKGGVLYARTPAVSEMIRFVSRLGISLDFTYPGHVHDLGQDFWNGIVGVLGLSPSEYRMRRSAPAIVETMFREAPLRTAAAYLLKAPWRLLGRRYKWVGGWEVFIERT